MSYNPYNGKTYEPKDLEEKSKRLNEKERKKYERDISFKPKYILEDTYEVIEKLLSPKFSIYDFKQPRLLKGLGFLIMVISALSLFFIFLQ